MPKPQKNFTEEERKEGGYKSVGSFFKPADDKAASRNARGRRTKRRGIRKDSTDGRAAIERVRSKKARRESRKGAAPDNTTINKGASPDDGVSTKTKSNPANTGAAGGAKRKDWSKDPTLEEAVKFFDNSRGEDKPLSANKVAAKFNLPPSTFKRYVSIDKSKRLKIGTKVGRKSILSEENSQFLCQVAIRADRANDGLTPADMIAKIQRVQPELTEKQAANHYSRSFLKKHKGKLKSKPVKAQKTTSRRSQCTVAQQFRWFNMYGKALKFLREKNTGVCRKTGKSFGELIEHFIIGGDETCLIADADGDMKIIGEFGRKKHEKRVSDCRSSCTMYRSGTSAGNNGPTVFVMKGVRVQGGFNEKFLVESGCEVGSHVQMTENAFMTLDAWLAMTPRLIKGYRSLPFIEWNPQWWVVEILDGFGAHLTSLEALRLRMTALILTIKEEGDSSSINQAYDKLVAKSDKMVQRRTLGFLRTIKNSNGFITQWDLIFCGLNAINITKKNPDIWINSFIAVNLHPRHQIPFADWCKKIEPFMKAADSFDLVTQSKTIDTYKLLPAYWQAMEPAQKRSAVAIVKRHESSWNLDCLLELKDALTLTAKQLPALQTCVWLAIDNPSHLDRGMEDVEIEDETPDEVANVESARCSATDDLSMFRRVPDGMSGEDLFDHQVAFRHRAYSKKPDEHKLDPALMISPRTKSQEDMLSIDYARKVQGDIMSEVGDGVNLKYAAQSKLDNIGHLKSHCHFVNDAKSLQRHEEKWNLARAMGSVEQHNKAKAKDTLDNERAQLSEILPGAIQMFQDQQTKKKAFTKDCIKAILVIAYGYTPEKSGKKSDWLDELTKRCVDKPENLDKALQEHRASAVSDLPPLPAAPAAAAAASNSNASWLYYRCVRAKPIMEATMSALELSLLALRALNKIEVDLLNRDDCDSDDIDECFLSTYFMNAFKGQPKRDYDFLNDLAEKAEELAFDDDVNEAELRKQHGL